MSITSSTWRARTAMLAATVLALAAVTASFGSGGASAKGGTAKPPAGNPAPLTPPIWPAVPAPVFSVNTSRIHGFDLTGFIQKATVGTTGCTGTVTSAGGTLVVNGITVVVPCNSVIQMPANTLTWPEAIDIATANAQALALDGSGANGTTNAVSANKPYPSFEASITGNIVGGQYIAGLIYLSQQSLNGGNGVVSRIDYATGDIWVTPEAGAGDVVRLQINDPNGRFGRAQSPDPRFSVDDENPTIHSGTGYPMCVPRVAPAAAPNATSNPTTETDPLCPQKNRPWSNSTSTCRNWTLAGVTPPAGAGELPATPINSRCRNYVMKAPVGLTAADADARQQAPIEPGDAVTWSGTLFKGATATAPDYVSVHTLEVNVGLYTQPGTLPTYLAIGEFGVGSADPSATSINGAGQEAQDRIFLEAETTDPKAPVDIYMMDMDSTGKEFERWITPFEMTGETNGPVVPAGANFTSNLAIGGGITTMNAGAQVQRARLRATKAPVGLLGSPTRMLRVVSRTQCLPNEYILNSAQATFTQQASWVTQGGNAVLPNAAPVPAIDSSSTVASTAGTIRQAAKPCLESTPVANGLFAGQYAAPVFEYIFPENVSVGEPVVPYDFWHLGFLVNGEGTGNAGALTPTPW